MQVVSVSSQELRAQQQKAASLDKTWSRYGEGGGNEVAAEGRGSNTARSRASGGMLSIGVKRL